MRRKMEVGERVPLHHSSVPFGARPVGRAPVPSGDADQVALDKELCYLHRVQSRAFAQIVGDHP